MYPNRIPWKRLAVALLMIGAAPPTLDTSAWSREHVGDAKLSVDFFVGKTRIKAEEVLIASSFAGRLAQRAVQEGEFGEVRQELATRDTEYPRAKFAQGGDSDQLGAKSDDADVAYGDV